VNHDLSEQQSASPAPSLATAATNAAPFISLAERIRAHGHATPDKPAVACDGRSLTYRRLVDQSEALATRIVASGLTPGGTRRVGILAANSLDVAVILAACQLLGATAVPLPTLVTPDAQARMIRDAQVALLFCQADRVANVKSALAALDTELDGPIIVLGGHGTDPEATFFQDWLSTEAGAFVRPGVQPDWVSDLIYSSGTTGIPKGIAQSFEGRARQCINLGPFGLDAKARVLQTVGLSSNFGLSALLAAWWWGGCCYMMSKFSGEQAVEALKREEINVAWLPPATLIRTMEAVGFEDAVKARECVKICAGAPLSANQKQLVVDTWPGPFYEIYGQTETASVTVLPVHAVRPDKLGSVGTPLSGVTVRILDDKGHELEVGEEGEIAAHSTTLMAGYHGQNESEPSTFWWDERGRRFVRTGDVGKLDDEGFLWLCDRKKDMIISGGYNVFPADIEKVLSDHPAIFEVAVIGCPSRRWGETPVAIVTLNSEVTTSAEELRDWANARLGAIQRVAAVRVVPELPSGGMGKILKRQLRAALIDAIGMLP